MSTRSKAVVTIIAAALGALYEFWLWGALSMTPTEMASKTSVWLQNPSVRWASILGFVAIFVLCVAVWFGEPLLKTVRRSPVEKLRGRFGSYGFVRAEWGEGLIDDERQWLHETTSGRPLLERVKYLLASRNGVAQ